jgi:hypothetical protein
MSIYQIEALLLKGKKRKELPCVESVNFTRILAVMEKKIKISLFLKTKKISSYINLLAVEENLTINDYSCSVGIGRGAKTFVETRVATYLISELSTEFKYHMINNLIKNRDEIILDCKQVPRTALSKRYK